MASSILLNGDNGRRVMRKPKKVDETVSNSSVLQDDNELFFEVDANRFYVFRMMLAVDSNATADFRAAVVGPAGAAGVVYGVVHAQGATVPPGTVDLSTVELGAAIVCGMPASGALAVCVEGSVTVGATSGVVNVQWAQRLADIGNTVVRAGSWLRAERM